ncbi:MAG: Fe-S cluster assembly protein SufD [Chthoniobacterales bacterium]|nr:Fe-S cluster assembly protein SufD [Chthoniobacterales bacterium]
MEATVDLEEKQQENFGANFEFHSPLSETGWPRWFELERSLNWRKFLEQPFPRRTDENWRFGDLRAVRLDGFRSSSLPRSSSTILEQSKGFPNIAARVVFGNNVLLDMKIYDLPSNVVIQSLKKAAKEYKSLMQEHFLRNSVDLGSSKFRYLHVSQLNDGLLIYVPNGVKVEKPIEVFYWVDGENSSVFPHTLILMQEASSATIIEHFRSFDGERALVCGVNDLHVSKRANLQYFAVQEWSEKALAFHLNTTHVEEEASVTTLSLNIGGGYVRGENVSHLRGEGARSLMLSINPVSGNRVVDQRTQQNHLSPGASSDLLYHNSLDEQARTIFAGLIKVAEGAHRTDAYQKVRNLILSDEAEANSMPGLEINADQVRCTHGATSGEINEEELFYLVARGIPRSKARRMIVMGFFRSVLERIEDSCLQDYFEELVQSHLNLK